MPNLPYHFARWEGQIVRRLYRAILPMIVKSKVRVHNDAPFEVFAYSGEATLPEQAASVRSFLAHVGRPKRFTIFSDGSYTRRSIQLLEQIHPAVHVSESLPSLSPALPEQIRPYLTTHPTGKQLLIIMSLPANGPALYADSDVLFFPGATDLIDLARTRDAPAFYLADYQFSGDERLLSGSAEKEKPANTGFLLLFEKIDWSLGIERLLKLKGAPNFFTNQTIVHLCMHANGAVPFDQRKYILQVDDQFGYQDRYAGSSLAMRHYVNPVRHKFWGHVLRRFARAPLT
jgi:hypothetical protein